MFLNENKVMQIKSNGIKKPVCPLFVYNDLVNRWMVGDKTQSNVCKISLYDLVSVCLSIEFKDGL